MNAEPQTPNLELIDHTPFVPSTATVSATFTVEGTEPTDIVEWELHRRLAAKSESELTVAVLSALIGPETNRLKTIGPRISPTQTAFVGLVIQQGNRITVTTKITTSDESGANPQNDTTAAIDDPGIYPLVVRIVRGGDVLTRATALVTRLPETGTALSVATIAPGPLQLSTSPSGKISMEAAVLSQMKRRADQLEADTKQLLTPTYRGETIEALFNADDPEAKDIGDRLRIAAARRKPLREAYSYMHLGAWSAQPNNPDFDLSLDVSAAAIDKRLGVQPDTAIIPPDASATTQSTQRLVQRGANVLLLYPSSIPPPPTDPSAMRGGETLDVGDNRSVPVYWVDEALSAQLPTTTRRSDLHLFLALLAAAAFEASAEPAGFGAAQSPPLAILDVSSSVPPQALAATFAEMATASHLLSPIPIVALADSAKWTPQSVLFGLGNTPVDVYGNFPQITSRARQQLNAYRNTVGDKDPTAIQTDSLLLLSTTLTLDQTQRTAYVATVRAFARRRLATISFENPGTVTVTSREVTIPLRFTNGTGYPATVRLTLDSDRIELVESDDEKSLIVLTPGESTVPLRLRVRTSGQFIVPLVVRTADNAELIRTERITVRSAAFSGVGVILSCASFLVLIVWWVRTHRKRSRSPANT